jgi:hypothetical protein
MISSVRQLDRLLQQLLVVVGRPNANTSGKSSLLYGQPIPTATPPAPTGTTGQPVQRTGIQHQCKCPVEGPLAAQVRSRRVAGRSADPTAFRYGRVPLSQRAEDG